MINSDSSKQYIAEAASGVKQNKVLEHKLLTSTRQIAVLGANCWHQCLVVEKNELIKKTLSHQPVLLAIRIKHKETEQWKLVETFSNEDGDKVLIVSFKPKADYSTP